MANNTRFKSLFRSEHSSYILIFILVLAIASVTLPKSFLSIYNIRSMLFQVPEFGILTFGMVLAILVGGIDLSIIANANLSGIIAAVAMHRYLDSVQNSSNFLVMLIVIVTAMGTGLVLGLFNGIIITRFSVPPILVTLGSMKLFDGVSTVITNGQPIRNFPDVIAVLGNDIIFGIPISFLLFAIIFVFYFILVERTRLGMSLYLLGENPIATRYSGLKNENILMKVFLLSGLFAGMAGIIMMSRFNSIKVGYGNSYLLQTVLVAVLGGVHPDGGRGRVLNVLFGILTLQVIASSFNLFGFSNYMRNVIYGTVLILVMIIAFLSPLVKKYLSDVHKNKILAKEA